MARKWPKTTSTAALEQACPPRWNLAPGLNALKRGPKTKMLTPKGEHSHSPLFYQGLMFDGRISFDGIAIRQKLW